MKKCLSDSGCTKTIISADVLQKHQIPIEPNVNGEKLIAANGAPMLVCGTVTLEGTFDGSGKNKFIDCLVTQQLENSIIVSWHDAEELGAITLVRQIVHDNPSPEDTSRTPEEIRAQIDKWLATYKCLSDQLPAEPVKGPPMKIQLIEGTPIRPKKARTPVRVPLHYQPFSDQIIDEMIRDGVIQQVERSSVSQFCARAFIVPKPSGGFRMVVDHSEVNKYIERPTHPFVAGNELLRRIPHTARVFAKLDALSSFHQIALHPDSRHITTFIHERGTFEYLRAPQGTNCSGDFWCRISDEAVADLPGVLKLIDDIAVYASNYNELFSRVQAVLDRCEEHGITLSRKKLEVGPKITFAGFDLSAEGVSPTADRTSAITDFPTPRSATDTRSFLGLGQQVAHFVPDWSAAAEPLRELTKKKNAFVWGPVQEEAFRTCKKILTGDLVLRPFNPAAPSTELIVDASRSGLGFLLMQTDANTRRRHLVQCGSRALQPAETRYAVCELEMLSCLFAIQKCKHYLLGMKTFELITDHRSLGGVFAKDLCDIENVRLRRYREKLQEYTFNVIWRPGKSNLMADALSRYPVSPPGAADDVAGPCVCNAITDAEASEDLNIAPLLAAAKSDADYQSLMTALVTTIDPSNLDQNKAPGLPADHPARAYDKVWKNLSVHPIGLVVLRNDRIVVPASYQRTILQKLHLAHCGIEKSKWAMTRDYYWPSCNAEVEAVVRACDRCRPLLPGLPTEVVRQMNASSGPMDLVGSDLFEIGKHHYICLVDQYSSYLLVERLPSITAASVISVLRHWFNLLGRPKRMLTDGGSQYTSSDTQRFLAANGISHYVTSVAFPSANGLSEASVKRAKYLLIKTHEDMDKFGDALLEFNNMPTNKDMSPAEMFFARRQRTSLPLLPGKTDLDVAKGRTGAAERKDERTNELRTRSSIEHPRLHVGQKVDICNVRGNRKGRWDIVGVVTEVRRGGRSYWVRKENGGMARYNRRFLRPLQENPPNLQADAAPTPSTSDTNSHSMNETPSLRNTPPAPRRSNRERKQKRCHSCHESHSVKCIHCVPT